MSTLVDERVVQMSFDNSNFEKNVRQTMNSLDDFKKTLDFDSVAKELDRNMSSIDMTPITYGLEQVKEGFTAWEIVAISVISNLTNRITNMGVKMVESLSVDNISSGWAKYGENVKSVGTLLSQDGNDINTVNAALEKLMWFTDQTSYSYTDMVSNISKFTATGQSLEDSVQAMMGIANWAALSGQNAATASRAMYQLSQAMGQGTVKLMDYKSIQNANMDTKEFRENALKTAVELGYLTERIEGIYVTTEKAAEAGKEFNVSQFATQLSSGWFTSDVLMKTLSTYSSAVDKLYDDVNDETKNFKTAAEAIEAYEQELEAGGTELEKFGLKAFKAAQEARTFEDVINATKDAVSSGWLSTFDKVFGDYDEAKKLWTDLADELWDVFAAGGEVRNNILQAWKELGGRADIFDKETGAFWNLFYAIKGVTDIIKEAWRSVFGFGKTLDDNDQYVKEAAENLKSITERLQESTAKIKNFVESISGDLQNALRGVFSILKVITKSVGALWTGIKPLFGLVSEGSSSILSVLGDVGDKFANFVETTDIFARIGSTIAKYTTEFVSAIKELHIMQTISDIFAKFVDSFKEGNKTAGTGKRIIDGLVAALNLLLEVGKAVFKVLSQIVFPLVVKLSSVASGVLGKLANILVRLLANIADVIVLFVNWLQTNNRFQNAVDKVINSVRKIPAIFAPMLPIFKGLGNILYRLLEIVIQLPKAFAGFVQKVTGSSIGEIFRYLGETISGAVKAIANALSGFRKIDTGGIDEFSDSVEPKLTPLQSLFMGLKNLFEGLWQVIKAVMPVIGAAFELIGQGLTWVANVLKNTFGEGSPIETIKKILSIGFWVVAIDYLYQMMYALKTFISSFSMIFEGIYTVIDSKAMMQYSEAMKTFAIAVLLIVASLVLLASMDPDKLAKGIVVLTTLMTMMVMVMKTFTKLFATDFTGFKSGILGLGAAFKQTMVMKSAATMMLTFAAAIGVLALTMKLLGTMSFDQISNSLVAIMTLTMMMVTVSAILNHQRRIMARGAMSLIMFAIAIRLLVKPIKVLGKMGKNEMMQGLVALGVIMAMLTVIGRITKARNAVALTAFATSLSMLSVGLLILSGTLAILSTLHAGKIWNAVGVITALLAIFVGIGKIVKIGDAATLAAFSVSLMLLGVAIAELTASVTILAALPAAKVWNGVGAITAFIVVMALVAKLVGIFSSLKLIVFATGMIALGKAMAIFAAVILILGTMNEDALTRGRETIQFFILAMAMIVKLVGIFSALKLNVFAAGMILLGAAMMEFALAISILGSMSAGDLWKGVGAIAAFVGVVILLSKLTSAGSSGNLAILGASLAVIAASMLLLTSSIAIFGNMNWTTLLKGFGVFVATLGVMIVLSKLLGPSVIVLLAFGAALTMVATAALMFASALSILVGLGSLAGLAIAELVTGLVDSLIALGPKLTEAMTAIVSALIESLSNTLTKIFELVDGLIGNIISLIANRGPAIIETVVNIITLLLEKLAKNMPSIAKSLMEILIALLDALKNAAGRIIQDVIEILFALIDKITENVPEFMKRIGNLVITVVEGAVQTLIDLVPRLINAAFDLVLGLIEGIGQAIEDNATKVRDTMISFCKHLWNAFLNFFGIHSPSKKAEEGSSNIILGIVKGIGAGIGKAVKAMGELVKNMWNAVKDWIKKFGEWGKNIVQGIWNGIKSVWNGFVNFWKNLWNGIKDWFCDLFGIHSPSRLFYQYGQNTVEGYEQGLEDGENGVYDSMEDIYDSAADVWSDDDIYEKYGRQINIALAEALINNSGIIYDTVNQMVTDSINIMELSKDEFQEVVQHILTIIQNEIPEDALTITPVINYDEIINGVSNIAGMLSTLNGYSVSGSVKLAEQTSNDMVKTTNASTPNGVNSTSNNGTVTGGAEYNIVFNISGADPEEVANEVNKKLQDFIDRRNKQWA